MPYSIQLHESLNKLSPQHAALASKFREFARFVKDCVQTPSISSHNITASLQHLDNGYFTTTFANRTISFAFTSVLEKNGNLVGNVKTYVKHEFPEQKQVKFGEFTFDQEGHTSLKLPNEDAEINIADNFGTLHIALHFIRESLSN